MPDPLQYLMALGAAAIVSAVSLLVISAVRPTASASWLNSACVLAAGLGLAAGYDVLSFGIAWPPAQSLDRFLTIIVPAALCIELIAAVSIVPGWIAWLLRGGLTVAMPRILLHGSVYLSGDDWTVCVIVAIGAGSLALLWGPLSWLSQRTAGVSILVALCLAIQCAGLTVMMAGYIKGGAAAFPFVAALLATAIGAKLITRHWTLSTGFSVSANLGTPAMIGIGVVGLFGLLFIGCFFGQLSRGYALAVLFAPLLCWMTELPPLRNRKPWWMGTLRLVLVSIPLVVVLILAKREFDRDMAPLLSKASLTHPFFVAQGYDDDRR